MSMPKSKSLRYILASGPGTIAVNVTWKQGRNVGLKSGGYQFRRG